jgi:cytochrome c peroxidase
MDQMGCTSCHVADLEIRRDRRVADVETNFNRNKGIFNRLFAVATGLFSEVDDGSGFASLKEPLGGSFLVENIFTDFKRHDLGPGFWERNFDGTLVKEFVTEPLWGVGSTPPYGHDGRSIDLEEVILRHGGEAEDAREEFLDAPRQHRQQVIAFLESLVLFPPDDTASTLDPGDRGHPEFPQYGHGSIALTVLFNDPDDIE